MTREFDLGFLGGGQLARMSIQAAQRMGLKCLSIDPSRDTPASAIAPSIVGNIGSSRRLAEVFQRCSRVTLENEFIPAKALREAMDISGFDEQYLTPGTETLALIQDKLVQRRALIAHGVPSPKAVEAENGPSLGFPLVLKARFGGYDGKGTRYANNPADYEALRPLWMGGGWLAEEFIPFRRELAVMVYVGRQAGTFPTMHTIQTNSVCDLVFPCDSDGSSIALDAVTAMNGRGLFGVELFELESGELLVNEIAPRPHNSGHFSLDWGGVSQFEQHVRIAMDWPTDSPAGIDVCMANLLGPSSVGCFQRAINAALETPGSHIHWYGKAECRPGRKMGHINAVGENCIENAKLARHRFFEAWSSSGT